ncbi:hypothetical protein BDR22DRAFT_827022 [Usnea florida]
MPHSIHKKPQDPPSSTAPFKHLSRKSSLTTFVPITRSWNQSSTNPSTDNAIGQLQNRYTTTSRWLSERQCEQPWNAIDSVPAMPVGLGTGEKSAKKKKNEKTHSACATRGSASSRR